MTKKSWLCRDWNGSYVICPLAKKPEYFKGNWVQTDRNGFRRQIEISALDFEKEFPKVKGKLRPRDPPIRIELTLRFCDE